MIPFNAASVEEYWEPLLVLPSEQRQVAGREPRSERQLEGRPGYLAVSPLRLRHHRAPITATRPTGTATHPTDTPRTAILATVIEAMDTQPTHSPAMDTQPTHSPAMDTQPTHSPAMDTQPTHSPAMDTQPTHSPAMDTQPTHSPAMD